jgi:outer membrane protein insertion porin family
VTRAQLPAILACVILTLAAVATAGEAPRVIAVDIVSTHALPAERIRLSLPPLEGRPLDRGAVRESLARLWALELFSEVRVEEIPAEGGVRVRYHLVRRPWLERLHYTGDHELDVATLASAAGLAIGGDATPERLARARTDLIERHRREGFLDADVDVQARANERTNGRDVTMHIAAGERARVGEIRVDGGPRLSPETIRVLLRIDEGDRYVTQTVREAGEALQRSIRDRGFFAARVEIREVRPHARSRRVHLDVNVQEGAHARIRFEGNTAITDGILHQRLTFADSGFVDEAEVRASARQIESAYRDRGYAFVAASGRVEETPTGLIITFDIREGPRVRVRRIAFTGDTGVPEARLRERMETTTRRLLGGGYYRPETLERDLLLLRGYLESEGFGDARAGPPEVQFSDDRTEAAITIPIAAGRRILVGTLDVSGTTALTREEALGALALSSGSPWSRARADEGRRALEGRYRRRGYHGVSVDYEAERRDGTMDVTYRVTEGSPTRVGRVLLEGLITTRPEVILRELPIQSGDPLDPEALIETQRRLSELGPFDRIDVEPLRPPPAPFADVRIAVRERRPWHVDLGVGYTTFEGARAFAEIGHDNLFGTARSATLRQRISERGDRTDVRYGEPRLLGSRWQGAADLFRERRQEIGFQFEQYGAAVGIQRDLFPHRIRGLRTAVRYQLAAIDRFDVDPTLVEADVTPGPERIATLTPELTLDQRDRPLDPTRGGYHLLALRAGSVSLGSDTDFLKARAETHWFFNWLRPTVIAVSARLGLAGPLGDSDTLPIEERFFAGGSTTVRGYRENRLGPLDEKGNPTGGNAMAILNLEWRFPLWRWIGGAVFFDTGAIASEVERLDPGDLRSGIGAGLRVSTPVGPLRLDVGYPLDRTSRQDREPRVYLSVGHAF